MNLSQYVFIFPADESHSLLFHSATGCLLKLASTCFDRESLLTERLTRDDLVTLQEGGFLAATEEIKNRLDSLYRQSSDTLTLSIELTGQCNLKCSYCYQNGWASRGTIGASTIEHIIAYIEKCTGLFACQAVKIDFIGGEPFIAVDAMQEIFSRIKLICRERGLRFEAQAETNGTLLKYERLRELDILDLSVTLSLPEDHNKMRPYMNGAPSYDRILSNLIDCRDLFKNNPLNLSLRYNVHAGNYRQFADFVAEMKRLQLPIKTIKTAYTAEHGAFHNGLTMDEFKAWNSSTAIDVLLNHGYPVPFFPHATTKRCEAYQSFNCKVFFDGTVGLCNASKYGTSSLSIRQLVSNPAALNEHYVDIKAWTPLQDAECFNCKELLLCGGKTFCRDNPCDYSSYNLKAFLEKYVHYSENGLGHCFV